jgi:hypothetical protein
MQILAFSGLNGFIQYRDQELKELGVSRLLLLERAAF